MAKLKYHFQLFIGDIVCQQVKLFYIYSDDQTKKINQKLKAKIIQDKKNYDTEINTCKSKCSTQIDGVRSYERQKREVMFEENQKRVEKMRLEVRSMETEC